MFDLFRRRDKTVRIVMGGLLGMVALSMLLYLIPGAGMTSSSSSGNDVIAEVGKETVTSKDIAQLVQERIQSKQLPQDMVQFLLPQLIDQRVNDIAVAYQANRMGFDVTDADLANAIRSLPNIGTLPPDQYRMYIQSMGMTVPEFEANMRKRMSILQLQNIALEGVVVTPQEIEQEYNRRNEKIKLEYISFDPAKLKTEIKPTPEQLQTYFATVRGQFSMPETRSFNLVIADPQMIAQTLQIGDDQLRKIYNEHKDQFRTPERVKARHILLMTQGKSKEEAEKIKAKAEDLLKKIRAGGDFDALAKQFSEDPGSKVKGGDLGWVTRGQMVKNFETACFTQKVGEVGNLVSTEYGYHIVQVMEKQEAHLQTFDEVKVQLEAEAKKSILNDRVQALADQAHAEIAKAPQNAEQIAQKLGLNYAHADKLKNGDPMPFVGVDKPLSEMVFSLKKGEVSPLTQAGNRLAVAIVTDITAPRQADLAEVEPQVRDRYTTEQAQKIAVDKSKQAADLLKSNGGDLKAVAKSLGMEVKTTDFFNRQGAAEGIGSASYFADAFAKPAGAVLGSVNAGSQTVVAKILEKQSADPSKLAMERDGILGQLKNKKVDERNSLFEDSVVTKLMEEKKIKRNKDVINQIMARFRS
jgi:peptidyl-prolyl cis-trans isomerase D